MLNEVSNKNVTLLQNQMAAMGGGNVIIIIIQKQKAL